MSGVNYTVGIDYVVSGNPNLDKPLQKIKESHGLLGSTLASYGSMFSKVGDSLGSMNSAFDQAAMSITSKMVGAAEAMGAALAGALGLAVHEGIKFNEEMENAKISLGVIFSMNGMSDGLASGMEMAKDSMKAMRRDAALLPGEFKDLVNIFQMIAPTAGQAGMNPGQIEHLSAQTMAAAAVLGVSMSTAGREMGMMLSGNARHNMPLFVKLGLGDSTAFNKLSQEDRKKNIDSKLSSMDPAFSEFQNSFTGLKTTAVDKLRTASGIITAPLFESVKNSLSDFISYSSSNLGGLTSIGQKIGESLKWGFEYGHMTMLTVIQKWGPLFHEFADNVYIGLKSRFERLTPIFEGLSSILERVLKTDDPVGKMEKGLSTILAMRAGSGAMSVATGMVGEGLGGIGSLLQSAPALGKAVTAIGGIGEVALIAAPIVLALAEVAGLAAFSIAGIVSAATDVNSAFHTYVIDDLKDLGIMLGQLTTEFGNLWTNLKPFAEFLGAGLLDQWKVELEIVIFTLQTVNSALSAFNSGLLSVLDVMGVYHAHVLNSRYGPKGPQDEVRSTYENEHEDGAAKANLVPPVHHTTIHKVEIKVNSNQDPSRIAKETFQELMEVVKHPLISGSAPQVGRQF